ncbi:Pol Polyprotein [Phytophthora megakarya]|uniref:Pol Polyprotein n=1 Tax=Phytophthora megakarya TaxID=4795 RepID=A0A225URQ4_9STRA|nr:Pol Polyprotein [Phytophthora megakarya]
MEVSTSAFSRPPNASLRSTAITSVRLLNGRESDHPGDISEQFLRHWGNVFSDERYVVAEPPVESAASTKLLDSITQRLPALASERLNAPLTGAGLAATIRHLKRNSAPGLDGLGPALYQLAPDEFGAILAVVFSHQLGRGYLLASQRRSTVTLLYKKGGCREPGNYRPISLMQVDVKILSKTLAHRLQRYLPLLIHPEQKGFVRGRSLHHHVRFLHELQELVRTRGKKASRSS